MIRPIHVIFSIVAVVSLAGCQQDAPPLASQLEQPAPTAPCELTMALLSNSYRGGENQSHWHLTRWSLRNDSPEAIAEAVVIVTLFDADETFLGHHAVTFQHVLPGETAQQQRLLLLKSENIDQWRPRCESVHSRERGDLTASFRIQLDDTDTNS